ncbi:conserved hypothetical protein, partial [Ricinus communis]
MRPGTSHWRTAAAATARRACAPNTTTIITAPTCATRTATSCAWCATIRAEGTRHDRTSCLHRLRDRRRKPRTERARRHGDRDGAGPRAGTRAGVRHRLRFAVLGAVRGVRPRRADGALVRRAGRREGDRWPVSAVDGLAGRAQGAGRQGDVGSEGGERRLCAHVRARPGHAPDESEVDRRVAVGGIAGPARRRAPGGRTGVRHLVRGNQRVDLLLLRAGVFHRRRAARLPGRRALGECRAGRRVRVCGRTDAARQVTSRVGTGCPPYSR